MNYSTLDKLLLRENRKLTNMVKQALREGIPLNNQAVVIQSQKVDVILNQLFALQKRTENVS